jgi:PPOX class probable F420-dependent enzyme
MPPTPVPPEIDEFLSRPNHAVVATLRPDGSPHTAVTWYDWEDGRVLLNMEATRLRLGWMARDGRVALTAIDPANFYRHISLLGRIVDIHEDDGLADIDRLSRRYTGGPYPARDAPRVSAWMLADAYHGWDPDAYRVIGGAAPPGAWRRAS